jgi:hypothetical protein
VELGASELHIWDYEVSNITDIGPFLPRNSTVAGPYTFYNLPWVISPESSITVIINFNPSVDGNFAAHLNIISDGGPKKKLTVVGTSGAPSKALIEFENPDGSGIWIKYNSTVSFSFGSVYQATTKKLKLRLSNTAKNGSSILDLTVSKPPIGAGNVVAAVNQIDLAEGTQIAPGESKTAVLFCSVPRSQPNVDSYIANATWTMNTNDPTMGKQIIQFVCNAVSQQVGPKLVGTTQARYRYIGCFKENNPSRQLQTQIYGSALNENGMCTNACFSSTSNYVFAGTQYHSECWCGQKLPLLKVKDTECNFVCSG